MKVISSPNSDSSVRVTKSRSDYYIVSSGEYTYMMDTFIEAQDYVLDNTPTEIAAEVITILGYLPDGIITTVTFRGY